MIRGRFLSQRHKILIKKGISRQEKSGGKRHFYYVVKFRQAFIALLQITPTVNSVNDLQDEEKGLEFIKTFRELMSLKNVLIAFTEFKFSDLSITEQNFEDYYNL